MLEAEGLDDARMQAIAAEVGYSETVFMRERDDGAFEARYFSPQAEVPFCGHATISRRGRAGRTARAGNARPAYARRRG